mmetsp:Transcript_4467/g.10390  ORF Transcript_4467/g.10390 Transcript_4467/m.10390 type:complete len:445 (+) Transcript_4467:863-2197(+)
MIDCFEHRDHCLPRLVLVRRPLLSLPHATSRKQHGEQDIHHRAWLGPSLGDEQVAEPEQRREKHKGHPAPIPGQHAHGARLLGVLLPFLDQQVRVPLQQSVLQAKCSHGAHVAHGFGHHWGGLGLVLTPEELVPHPSPNQQQREHSEGHQRELPGSQHRVDDRHGKRGHQLHHHSEGLPGEGLDKGDLGGEALREVTGFPRVHPPHVLVHHGAEAHEPQLASEGLGHQPKSPLLDESARTCRQSHAEEPQALLVGLDPEIVGVGFGARNHCVDVVKQVGRVTEQAANKGPGASDHGGGKDRAQERKGILTIQDPQSRVGNLLRRVDFIRVDIQTVGLFLVVLDTVGLDLTARGVAPEPSTAPVGLRRGGASNRLGPWSIVAILIRGDTLQFDQLGVQRPGGPKQTGVGTLLQQDTVLQNDDLICILNRGQPVRNHNGGAALLLQ